MNKNVLLTSLSLLFFGSLACLDTGVIVKTDSLDYTPSLSYKHLVFCLKSIAIDKTVYDLANEINTWQEKVNILPACFIDDLRKLHDELSIFYKDNRNLFKEESVILSKQYEAVIKQYNKISEQEATEVQDAWNKEPSIIAINRLIEVQQKKNESSLNCLQKMEKVEKQLKKQMRKQLTYLEAQIKKIVAISIDAFKKHKELFESFKKINTLISQSCESDKAYLVEGKFKLAQEYITYCNETVHISLKLITYLNKIIDLVHIDALNSCKEQLSYYQALFLKKIDGMAGYSKQLEQRKDEALKKEVVIKCAACSKIGDFKKCGRCQEAHYCSRDCQSKDWNKHKLICCERDTSFTFKISVIDSTDIVTDSNDVSYIVNGSTALGIMHATHPQSKDLYQLMYDPAAQFNLSFINKNKKYNVVLDESALDIIARDSFKKSIGK